MNNKIYLADLTHTGSGLMALTFPLGTSYVAGYSNKVLSNEFDFKLFKLPEDLIKAISKESPLVLALSNYSWNIELGYKVIEWAKDLNPNLITVVGGPNFPTESSEKQDFLKFRSMVDFYIESEGEVGFVDLLRKLKEYDFNFKAIKRAQEKIINCTYLGENCLIEATIQRITDVNMLPSPYLNGSMDEFFKLPLIPMIETNRGCPFSCTFCADGLKYKNKVYSYDTSRVREELHYIYENVKKNGFKMDELRISDLNFGMYREDKETAGYIAELQSNYGWPKLVRGSLGKNRHDRIMDMLGLLKGTFPMGAALQSTDETVLKNIKRSNISVESYKKVMEFMNKTDKKSKTFSELILGLPGDSKKTHFQSLKTVIENKVNTIRQFQAILLSGTEMANPQTRDKFKLLTKHRIMTGAVGKYKFGDDEVPITEIEEIIVGSKDMSFDDYVTCRKMLLIIETFHNNALFEEFFLALEKLGISEWECLVYILNHDEIYTSKIKEIMLSYVNSTKYGLYETYEQAKTHSVRPGRYEKHLSGEIGSRELVEHKGLLYNEMDDLVKIMVKVSNKFMIHYGTDVHQDSRDYFEQLGDYIICAKGNIVVKNTDPTIAGHYNEAVYDWEFNYHWTDIGKLNFEIDPRKIKRYKENLSFKFFHNKDQKDRIKNAIALHPNHPTAAPMLYNQNMKMLYRLPEIVPDKQFYQDTETMNNINKEKLKSTMISLFYDPTRWDDRKGKEIMDIIDDEGAISKEKTDFMVVPSTFMFLSSNGTVITCHSNIETQEEQELRNSASSMEHTGIALWTLWKYIRDNPDEDEEKIKELFKVQKSHGNGCECSTICTATFEDIIGSPKLFGELSMDEVVNIISNQQKFMSGHQIVGNFINITRASRIVYEKNDSSRILAIDSYALTDTQIDFFLKFIIANKISPENLYILDRDKSGTLSKQLGLNEREVNHCNRYPLKQPVGLLAY